jgi:cysteine desulfurase
MPRELPVPVYLDHNATTPLDSQALEAMLPFLREQFGNPSSVHRFGRATRAAVDNARARVGELVGVQPEQVIFTAGGTEANNLALKGVAGKCGAGRLLIGATEHSSVSRPARQLAARGWEVRDIPVDEQGRVNTGILEQYCADNVALVSVMMANNETGTIQDIAALGRVARGRGAIFHTDAVQAVGKIPVNFHASGAQLMSLSAHKLNGPKGVGALIVDKSIEIEAQLAGGGQERNRRSGTENVAGIVGFGVAAAIALERMGRFGAHLLDLRKRLESGLRAVGGITIFSADAERLPNTVCFAAEGVEGETLVMGLDRAGMAVSSGSACGSGKSEPNPVLTAMGVAPELARGSVRVSLGAGNNEQDIDSFIAALADQLQRLRGMARRAYA